MKKTCEKMFFISGLVILIFCFIIAGSDINKAYAQCEECSINFENEDDALKEAAKYITIDEDGRKIIDILGAKQSNEDKYIIRILEIAEQIQQDEEIAINSLSSHSLNVEPKLYNNLSRYGHYCGKGNDGWNKTPIDDLDRACKAHDRCYVWGGNNTQCNATFCSSLNKIIAKNPKTTYKGAYARSARLIFCWF